jgi:hypothetical protein
MVERPLKIELDEPTAVRLETAAAAASLSVEAYVLEVIKAALSPPGVAEDAAPFDLADPRTEAAKLYQREQALIALAEYDRTGVSFPLEDVLRDVRADLEARLASKA